MKNNYEITNGEKTILENSMKIINRSASIGNDILNDLEEQNIKLEVSNDILESDEYLLNKTLRIIRDMSWSGMIWNLFFAEPIMTIKNTEKIDTNSDLKSIYESNVLDVKSNDHNIKSNDRNIKSNVNNKKKIFKNLNIEKNLAEQDDYLNLIESKLDELTDLSVKIGTNLKNQNSFIKQIDKNTETITNKMLKVNLETKKLTNYYNNFEYKIVGKFNFIDINTGLALGIGFAENLDYESNTNLESEFSSIILTNKIDLSTIFICYSTPNNIYYLQNYKTLKFLKTDFLGNISFSGNQIGIYEQCFLNLNKKNQTFISTGILILSKNNYNGGWLKNPLKNTSSKIKYINFTSSNTTDTNDIIIFQPIKLD